jgi:hypothetical protein
MEKIYLGNGTEKFDGDQIEFAINLSKIKQVQEHIFEYKGEKYLKLRMVKKREADQYGRTHYIEVNTFKPEQQPTQQAAPMPTTPVESVTPSDAFNDDIPF